MRRRSTPRPSWCCRSSPTATATSGREGRSGKLVLLRCRDCGYYLHPPIPVCPRDGSKNLAPEAVSGRATLATYTVNHHPWIPGLELPYVVALVEIVEQPELRLTTNLVGCALEEIRPGMAVRVLFRHIEDARGDVWLPLFEPDRDQR